MNFWEDEMRPFTDWLDATVGIVAGIAAIAGLVAFALMVAEAINSAA